MHRFGLAKPVGALVSAWRNGRLLKASAWTILPFLVGNVARIGANLLMTRLLVPEMFGVMSIILVIQVILANLSDLGMRVAVIQSHRGNDPEFLNTVWVLEIARAAVLFTIGVAIATGLWIAAGQGWLPASTAWASPDLPACLAVAMIGMLISGFQSTKLMTAARNIRVDQLAIIELCAQLGGIVVMIVFGLLTRSIWALVCAGIVTAVISMLMSHFWLAGPNNRFALRRDCLPELFQIGRWILLSSTAGALAANSDRLFLASYVDAGLLGLYAIALNLLLFAEGSAQRVFHNVLLPAASETNRSDPAAVGPALTKPRYLLDSGYLFLAGLVVATGEVVVRLLYDDRYLGAGGILQILAVGMVLSRYQVFPAVYLAMGHAHLMAIVNVVRVVAIGLLIPIGFALGGSTGAIWAVALHALPAVALTLWFNRRLGLNNALLEVVVLPAAVVGYLVGLSGVRLLGLLGW